LTVNIKKLFNLFIGIVWVLSFGDESIAVLPDTLPIEQPQIKKISLNGDKVDLLVVRPFIEFLSISRYIRIITGNRTEAYNADAFDEIGNSSWFTHRISSECMPVDEIIKWPDRGKEPDTSGIWLITKVISSGASRSFAVQDTKGDNYLIKFDPPDYPELSTNAELISTKIMYAAGYNVPENYLTVMNPQKLLISDSVTIVPVREKERKMNRIDLDSILFPLERLPHNRIRVLASKYIEGIYLGGWRYLGTRKDDSNDFIPHEHRREIRGLRIISGWLNNFDNIINNNLDVYDQKRKFVRHYLLDFNNTFGSYTTGPMPQFRGHQMIFKMTSYFTSYITSGFYSKRWERFDTIPFRSVGAWEAVTYEPHKFQFSYYSLAFEKMTLRDALWATKIVMQFSDSIIDTIVHQGQYSDPAAKRYVADILKERRDKIGRYYSDRICALDNFNVTDNNDSRLRISFDDLAVKWGFETSGKTTYEYWYKDRNDKKVSSSSKDLVLFIPDTSLISTDTLFLLYVSAVRQHDKKGNTIALHIKYDQKTKKARLSGIVRKQINN
jgi:hypothetical protein